MISFFNFSDHDFNPQNNNPACQKKTWPLKMNNHVVVNFYINKYESRFILMAKQTL